MDIPGGNALADRLTKLLPPQLQESKDGQPSQAQQIQQMQQALQQMTQQLEALNAYSKQLEGEMQRLHQENKLFQLRMADKEQENVLQADSNDIKRQEMQINMQEAEWNHLEAMRKLDIEYMKVTQSARNGQEG